jgi:hypothetical protein
MYGNIHKDMQQLSNKIMYQLVVTARGITGNMCMVASNPNSTRNGPTWATVLHASTSGTEGSGWIINRDYLNKTTTRDLYTGETTCIRLQTIQCPHLWPWYHHLFWPHRTPVRTTVSIHAWGGGELWRHSGTPDGRMRASKWTSSKVLPTLRSTAPILNPKHFV